MGFYYFLGLVVAFMLGLILGVHARDDSKTVEKIQDAINKVKGIDPDPTYPPGPNTKNKE